MSFVSPTMLTYEETYTVGEYITKRHIRAYCKSSNKHPERLFQI